ncbi:MAG: TauD/TfdA family dioxygenase [Pseudomonadota bacterium]
MKRANEFDVIATGSALGAEVRGIDLSKRLSANQIQELESAWAEHLVLLVRNQALDDADLVRLTQCFGGPQASGRLKSEGISSTHLGDANSPQRMVSHVSNLGKQGSGKNLVHTSGSSALRWHSDNSYAEIPPKGTVLWADTVPGDDSGRTLFCNMIQAYQELPDDTKALIEGKHTKQDSSRNMAGKLLPGWTLPASLNDIAGAEHPLSQIHPPSGKRALFLGRRIDYPSTYITEMPTADGEAVLDLLWSHATQEKFVWSHSWQRGDLVLWDNRAVMHCRTPINPERLRFFRRILIKGEPVVTAWA